ncbi:MAG: extracellular solute-binding protein [Hyphomicrobiaceae bacterium]
MDDARRLWRAGASRKIGRSQALSLLAALAFVAGLGAVRAEAPMKGRHGIAMHGVPALASGFAHLPYVNPDAPKGGTLRLGELGTYDSLNPFILKGVAPAGIREYVYESLLSRTADEPFTLYAHLAQSVDMPDDRSSITFHLDPAARFSDGEPVTAEDVLFSWRLLREKGQPYHRAHYSAVAHASSPAPGVVRFEMSEHGNRETPLLVALMPILPRHKINPDTFDQTSLEAPIGSGPYVVGEIDPGRSLTLVRNRDWWGRDRPMARGRYNVDRIRLDYFRDQTTLFEAFKSGEIDERSEDDAGRWAEGYDFPGVRDGRIVRAELPTGWPAGMTALVFNTRRPSFADQRVRRALILAFDFEWVNRNLFHGHYTRTQSFFARSELSSHGVPADAAERALLAPWTAKLKAGALDGTFVLPVSDGSGRNRANLKAAIELLREAGYVQQDGRMVDAKSQKPLAFEMMAAKRGEERLFQAYARSLALIGIDVSIRVADSAQRWARLKAFDFDMMQWTWGASLSPGNEQRNRWGSASADAPNALNFAGVKEPAVDALIEAVVAARERPAFVSAVRALDRLLLSGDYVIPLYHAKGLWVAWRSELRHPTRAPLSGMALETWWKYPGASAGN